MKLKKEINNKKKNKNKPNSNKKNDYKIVCKNQMK